MSNYRISIEEDAKFDIAEGYDWYSKISEKASDSFLVQIKKTIEYLEQDPFLFQLIYKNYRHVPVKKFPFVIIYKVETQSVKIYRVFSTKMDPSSKFKILRN
jgi:toxin ParE1/3/4